MNIQCLSCRVVQEWLNGQFCHRLLREGSSGLGCTLLHFNLHLYLICGQVNLAGAAVSLSPQRGCFSDCSMPCPSWVCIHTPALQWAPQGRAAQGEDDDEIGSSLGTSKILCQVCFEQNSSSDMDVRPIH